MTAIDLRSDTVTKPTLAMRQAMFDAPVGDDVFDEDPTIHALQDKAAAITAMEASLFVPSGTMANQIALLLHCRPGDDVIVGHNAHIYLYESGGGAAIAGVQFSPIGAGGHFSCDELEAAIKTTDSAGHIPPTTLMCVENTHNRGGGLVMTPSVFETLANGARRHGLGIHIDGARLFHAAAAEGVMVDAWTQHADTVSICLSKGLGAPVGSMLCGSAQLIKRAKRYRKMLGGGMRQAGVLAAAGLYALEHHVSGCVEDNRRALDFGRAIASMPGATLALETVRSNIVVFRVEQAAQVLCNRVKDDVLILPMGPHDVRAVFHREIDDEGLARAVDAIRRALC